MDLKALVKEVVAKIVGYFSGALETIIKPAVELELKKQIEEHAEKHVDLVLEKLKVLIPGPFDDGMIDANKAKLKADVKKALLAEADKISDKV